jgi:hypothetical protein
LSFAKCRIIFGRGEKVGEVELGLISRCVLYGPMMSTGSNMNPKPVPAWLNSAAWTSKPRSPMRSSYSFGERSGSGTVLEPLGKPGEDPLSSVSKEAVKAQEESDTVTPQPIEVQIMCDGYIDRIRAENW